MKTNVKHKKGYYQTLGIAFGTPLGIPIGLALGNIAYGPLIGVLIGLIVGYVLETKYNREGADVNAEETARQRNYLMLFLAIGVFVLTIIISEYFYLTLKP